MSLDSKREAAHTAYFKMLAERALAGRGPSAAVVVIRGNDPFAVARALAGRGPSAAVVVIRGNDPFAVARALVDVRMTPSDLAEWEAENSALDAVLPPLALEDLELPKLRVRCAKRAHAPRACPAMKTIDTGLDRVALLRDLVADGLTAAEAAAAVARVEAKIRAWRHLFGALNPRGGF